MPLHTATIQMVSGTSVDANLAAARALLEQDFDSLGFNISDADRAWNRGQSQDEWKEVKEAYVDVEVLDTTEKSVRASVRSKVAGLKLVGTIGS